MTRKPTKYFIAPLLGLVAPIK